MTFDEFIESCAADCVNATVPSDVCGHCQSQTFIYEDDGPACLPCFLRSEKFQVGLEKVESGLTELLQVCRELKDGEKEQARRYVDVWRVALELVAQAVAE